jgi:hypothetical protein
MGARRKKRRSAHSHADPASASFATRCEAKIASAASMTQMSRGARGLFAACTRRSCYAERGAAVHAAREASRRKAVAD